MSTGGFSCHNLNGHPVRTVLSDIRTALLFWIHQDQIIAFGTALLLFLLELEVLLVHVLVGLLGRLERLLLPTFASRHFGGCCKILSNSYALVSAFQYILNHKSLKTTFRMVTASQTTRPLEIVYSYRPPASNGLQIKVHQGSPIIMNYPNYLN